MGPIAEADAAQVRATVELNLIGTFLTIKHAAPLMAQGVGEGIAGADATGGSIIAMSSGAGHFPHRFLWAYGAAKAGIDMLCQYAAEELGPSGIRVNTVRPGIIDDELMAPITAGGPLLDDYLAQMPISRLGTVEDVAAAVRFLAGPEAGWISGECLAVDGGHHLRRGADYGLLFGA
jgi:NAD(P)-dependent dehydrogenase (short-subunit alcohol dehydrogenase family)